MFKNNHSYLAFILLLVALLTFATTSYGFQKVTKWVAPPEADKISNPLKGSSAATASGQKLYTKMCTICHGNKGKGDGMAGMSLNPRPTNFTLPDIQSQSDGAIFWKLTNGRAPMAAYKGVLTDEERWQLVNFIRTLKK